MDNVKTANIAIFAGVLVCGLISGRPPLHAQTISNPITIEGDDKPWNKGVPPENREAARALFLEGNKLFYLPMYAQAEEKYVAALAKWKHPAFYFNLALTQLNLGRELEAHENLQKAVQQGEEPLGAIPFREAQKQLENLERQLGRIRITCSTVGAEVTMDGTPLFTGPGSYEGWVKAKVHEIKAKRSDYVPQAKRLAIFPGTIETLDLRLVTLVEATESSRRWAAWKPWVVATAGATITVAGGVFHTLASRNFNSFDSGFLEQPCAKMSPPVCHDRMVELPAPANLYARLDAARRERTIALGGYIAGGSLLATGAVLLYLNRPRLLEHNTTTSSTRATAVPLASNSMLGIEIHINY